MTEIEIIERIKGLDLRKKGEAFELYNTFCDFLKGKYGLVDRDFDDKPTKRGKEWIDIHHILEYDLDDIARRTETARSIARDQLDPTNKIIVMNPNDYNNTEKRNAIRQKFGDDYWIYGAYTLEELKPYNVKEQLVYANKIEHFLLHYLIDIMRGRDIFSGGPNYLWDSAVAIDLYGFDQDYMNRIKSEKEKYYSLMSSEEITLLYKKMIDGKHWDIKACSRFWTSHRIMLNNLENEHASYVEDKDKYFKLMGILDYEIDEETKNQIVSLPFMFQVIGGINGTKIKGDCWYSFDLKTILLLRIYPKKSFIIPSIGEKIPARAFRHALSLEMLTIPVTIKWIDNNAFTACRENGERYMPRLKKIKYKGTAEMWKEHFSNVDLDGIKLVCEKNYQPI